MPVCTGIVCFSNQQPLQPMALAAEVEEVVTPEVLVATAALGVNAHAGDDNVCNVCNAGVSPDVCFAQMLKY